MAEVAPWEKQFVHEYIVPEKRDRYLTKLKGPKHRQEILNRLNHLLDYRPETATLLSPQQRTTTGVLDLLRQHYVADTCHIMADGNPHDGRELRIELAVEELLGNAFGFIMICPPVPIAVYKQEDIGEMFLLRPTKT
jgi:hypothetical protein